jgi:hypothetical protein
MREELNVQVPKISKIKTILMKLSEISCSHGGDYEV